MAKKSQSWIEEPRMSVIGDVAAQDETAQDSDINITA